MVLSSDKPIGWYGSEQGQSPASYRVARTSGVNEFYRVAGALQASAPALEVVMMQPVASSPPTNRVPVQPTAAASERRVP